MLEHSKKYMEEAAKHTNQYKYFKMFNEHYWMLNTPAIQEGAVARIRLHTSFIAKYPKIALMLFLVDAFFKPISLTTIWQMEDMYCPEKVYLPQNGLIKRTRSVYGH